MNESALKTLLDSLRRAGVPEWGLATRDFCSGSKDETALAVVRVEVWRGPGGKVYGLRCFSGLGILNSVSVDWSIPMIVQAISRFPRCTLEDVELPA